MKSRSLQGRVDAVCPKPGTAPASWCTDTKTTSPRGTELGPLGPVWEGPGNPGIHRYPSVSRVRQRVHDNVATWQRVSRGCSGSQRLNSRNSLDSVRRSRRAQQLVDFWSVSADFTFFAKLFYLEICRKMDENGRFQTIGNSKSLQISDIGFSGSQVPLYIRKRHESC